MSKTFDTFTRAYIEAALWISLEPDETPLAEKYSIEDISPDTLKQIQEDCAAFQTDYWDAIANRLERAGHDFWLTRNRHGAGFWDGDWPEDIGKVLTDAARAYGEFDLCLGDDGKIYHV